MKKKESPDAATPAKKDHYQHTDTFSDFHSVFSIMIWHKYRSSHEVTVTPPQQNEEGNRMSYFFCCGRDTTGAGSTSLTLVR
jgi:hypothetical protein